MESSESKTKKKIIAKHPLILIFLFLLVSSPFAFSQVVQTQVIDLSEKARNFFIEATKGNIQGQETFNKFGENLGVSTVEQDIQSQGGVLTFLQIAELITISSNNAADTIAGTNARSVEIFGLDENFTEISEIVNLAGITNVNTTKEYIRVNRFNVKSVGGYGNTNLGIITAAASLNQTTQIEIPASEGQSQTTHYTVPAGKEIIITALRVTMDTGKSIDIFLKIRENADDTVVPVSPTFIIRNSRGLDVPIGRQSLGDLKFTEKTDVWVTTLVSTGSAQVEANYDYLEYAIGT